MSIEKDLQKRIRQYMLNFDNIIQSDGIYMKVIKENKKIIVFDNAANIKICEVTQKQLKEYAKPIKLGDAYVFMDGEMSKVKTVFDG